MEVPRKKPRLVAVEDAPLLINEQVDAMTTAESIERNPKLSRSREFLFRGLSGQLRQNILLDEVASYSVTETHMADRMSQIVSRAFDNLHDITILDGMACVGGNTISFAKFFPQVLSNEFSPSRYEMLKHNVSAVMKLQNVRFFNASILDLATADVISGTYQALFLDPEWGGPDYKYKKNLRLHIATTSVEDFVLNILQSQAMLMVVALKLPMNYDNAHLRDVIESNGYQYIFYNSFTKMTLTIIRRKVNERK